MTTGKIVRLLDANKAKAAFLAPLLTAIAAAFANWIITGEFDDTEVRMAAGGAVLAAASSVATYLTRAGDATVDPRLPAQRPAPGIYREDGYSLVEMAFALLLVIIAVAVLFHFL